MPTDDFRIAALPVLERGDVDALEWSFDQGFAATLPPFVEPLLDTFAVAGRLYGHGVHLSPCSAAESAIADRWLQDCRSELSMRDYRLVSEHVGTSRAADLVRGAPLPVPPCAAAVAVVRANLRRLAEAGPSATRARMPIGLENLALAFSRAEALVQGSLVDAALEPFGDDGFVLLDLHNAYCQMYNFDIDADEWLGSWPLDRVRVVHVSGGSWSTHSGRRLRRDTHDGSVPAEVLELLYTVLARAPNVEVVVTERLGGTIADPAELAADFAAVKSAVAAACTASDDLPASASASKSPRRFMRDPSLEAGPSDARELAAYQDVLVAVLAGSASNSAAATTKRALLAHPQAAPFRAYVEAIDEAALDVACTLVARHSRRA